MSGLPLPVPHLHRVVLVKAGQGGKVHNHPVVAILDGHAGAVRIGWDAVLVGLHHEGMVVVEDPEAKSLRVRYCVGLQVMQPHLLVVGYLVASVKSLPEVHVMVVLARHLLFRLREALPYRHSCDEQQTEQYVAVSYHFFVG